MNSDEQRYVVEQIPVSEIFRDDDMNCRGRIIPATCQDLAESIRERGLDSPIQVQPYDKKLGKKYRIVSGHRRFTAFLLLKLDTIPCFVRRDLTDEVDVREANLLENVQRTDLTILQEAEAISYFVTQGYAESHIAKRLGKSNGWVTTRRMLMHLPEYVQKAASEGVVNQNHIKQLYQYRDNPEKLLELVTFIKERAEAGEKAIQIKENMNVVNFAKVRRPTPREVSDILAILGAMVTNKLDDDFYFPHRALAWAAGNISLAEFYVSLRKECERLELPFTPPEDVRVILDSLTKKK